MTQIAPPVRRRHAATRPPQPLPTTARWQAALSAFTLLALVAGVPAVLVAVSGWPVPHQLPTWEQVGQALLRPDDGTLLVNVLLAVAWVAWVVFTISVAAELPAVLRGRRSRRIPGLGHVQGLAAQLVASALVLLPSVTSSTAAFAATPAAVAATAVGRAPAVACAPAETATVTQPATAETTDEPSLPVYVVRGPHDGRRDTLWTIAAEHLGNPLRWHEIADLNLQQAAARRRPAHRPALDPPRLAAAHARGRHRTDCAAGCDNPRQETLRSRSRPHLDSPRRRTPLHQPPPNLHQPVGRHPKPPPTVKAGSRRCTTVLPGKLRSASPVQGFSPLGCSRRSPGCAAGSDATAAPANASPPHHRQPSRPRSPFVSPPSRTPPHWSPAPSTR